MTYAVATTQQVERVTQKIDFGDVEEQIITIDCEVPQDYDEYMVEDFAGLCSCVKEVKLVKRSKCKSFGNRFTILLDLSGYRDRIDAKVIALLVSPEGKKSICVWEIGGNVKGISSLRKHYLIERVVQERISEEIRFQVLGTFLPAIVGKSDELMASLQREDAQEWVLKLEVEGGEVGLRSFYIDIKIGDVMYKVVLTLNVVQNELGIGEIVLGPLPAGKSTDATISLNLGNRTLHSISSGIDEVRCQVKEVAGDGEIKNVKVEVLAKRKGDFDGFMDIEIEGDGGMEELIKVPMTVIAF